jgi:hypothetical protein
VPAIVTELEGGWLRRRIHPLRQGGLALWALFVGVVVLATREVLRESAGPKHRHGWLRPVLLGVGPSVTLLVAVISLLTIRRQLALANRPYLTYTTRWLQPDEPSRMLLGTAARVWVAAVRNAGPGTAVICEAKYRAQLKLSAGPPVEIPLCPYEGFRQQMTAHGKYSAADTALVWLGRNSAIEPGGLLRICEFASSVQDWLVQLDVEVRYRSLLGNDYFTTIRCVPKSGIPGTEARIEPPASSAEPDDDTSEPRHGAGRTRAVRTRKR